MAARCGSVYVTETSAAAATTGLSARAGDAFLRDAVSGPVPRHDGLWLTTSHDQHQAAEHRPRDDSLRQPGRWPRGVAGTAQGHRHADARSLQPEPGAGGPRPEGGGAPDLRGPDAQHG